MYLCTVVAMVLVILHLVASVPGPLGGEGPGAQWTGSWNISDNFTLAPPLVKLNGLFISQDCAVLRQWGGVLGADTLAAGKTAIASRLWHPNVYLGLEYDTTFSTKTQLLSHNAHHLRLQRDVRLGTSQ